MKDSDDFREFLTSMTGDALTHSASPAVSEKRPRDVEGPGSSKGGGMESLLRIPLAVASLEFLESLRNSSSLEDHTGTEREIIHGP